MQAQRQESPKETTYASPLDSLLAKPLAVIEVKPNITAEYIINNAKATPPGIDETYKNKHAKKFVFLTACPRCGGRHWPYDGNNDEIAQTEQERRQMWRQMW